MGTLSVQLGTLGSVSRATDITPDVGRGPWMFGSAGQSQIGSDSVDSRAGSGSPMGFEALVADGACRGAERSSEQRRPSRWSRTKSLGRQGAEKASREALAEKIVSLRGLRVSPWKCGVGTRSFRVSDL